MLWLYSAQPFCWSWQLPETNQSNASVAQTSPLSTHHKLILIARWTDQLRDWLTFLAPIIYFMLRPHVYFKSWLDHPNFPSLANWWFKWKEHNLWPKSVWCGLSTTVFRTIFFSFSCLGIADYFYSLGLLSQLHFILNSSLWVWPHELGNYPKLHPTHSW